MSIRNLAVLMRIMIVVMAAGTVLLTISVSQRFAHLLYLELALYGVLVFALLRCPRCGTNMYARRANVRGANVRYWGGFAIPTSCSHCRLSFDETQKSTAHVGESSQTKRRARKPMADD